MSSTKSVVVRQLVTQKSQARRSFSSSLSCLDFWILEIAALFRIAAVVTAAAPADVYIIITNLLVNRHRCGYTRKSLRIN